MKLTKEQIKQVENYLTKKGIKYIDIRFEVLDHISTDLEYLIEHNNYSFGDAFKEVTIKWNKSFKKTSSLLLGYSSNGPKMLIKKCIKIYKPLFVKSLILVFLFIAIGYSVNYYFEYSLINYKNVIHQFIYLALILYCGIILFWYIKIRLGKANTTFSYLFRKRIIPNLFSVFIFMPYLNDSYITRENKLSVIMFAMLFVFFLTFLGARYFFKNHLKAVSNYKKYQLK
ncbi:hypothetical protein Lupro_08265 [Lutibacter profundi]|uniref:Uncharacterized protein n=1 Tax=Lutibacter profundi TaxID=1622118 RepID=A0A0X8G6Z9_9FLAO|nr:hypothetical protein [Lutibacter profundi]AMC11248.1 hypothetical protein Lupro_08265 [Lutibacter profundi]